MTAASDIAIIGAGFTGLSTAASLKRSGVRSFVVIDRTVPGATWRDDTVRLFGLGKHVRFGHEVTGVAYDEPTGHWNIEIAGGERWSVTSVVLATGPDFTARPSIPGVQTYAGTIVQGQEVRNAALANQRVAVIGNGATAAAVLPEIVQKAASVKLFQSSPDWVLPRPVGRIGRSLARIPTLRSATRQAWFWGRAPRRGGMLELFARHNLRSEVADPWIRRQLTPLALTGRPNVVVTDEFYSALQAPNCKLITWPIARVSPGGIRTAEGIEHQCDVIVLATAFDGGPQPFEVVGEGGRSLQGSCHGVTVAGFPNLFMAGPPVDEPGRDALRRKQARVECVVAGLTAGATPVRSGPVATRDVRA